MGTQSRRHQPRKRLLHLESFERRDVPAVTHPLLSPLLSAPLSFVPATIHGHHEGHFALPVVGQTDAHVSAKTKADHVSAKTKADGPLNMAVTSSVDTSSSPVDARTTAEDRDEGTGVSGSDNKNTSSSDNVSTRT